MRIYEVGGCVRDKFLGLKSKDIDFTFVLDESEISTLSVAEGYQRMKDFMLDNGYTIFLESEKNQTIRGKFPSDHKKYPKQDADFVLARKEHGYTPGTREPILTLGTLYDDLYRRDFTVNAMAEDEEGNLIDLFNGRDDLEKMILRTPNETHITFGEDPLRILRAIRFSITKGFLIGPNMYTVIDTYDYEEKMEVVSRNRIRDELFRCFAFNTLETLKKLETFPTLRDYIFKDKVLWLEPTDKKV